MILLFSVSLWRFISLSVWESWWCQWGSWVAWVFGKDGAWCVLGFVSLSPLVPLPERKLARAAWPPSGGHGYGNQLKNRTQDGFHSLKLPLQKGIFVYFFSFCLAPGRNGLFCTCLKYTKHISWWKVPPVAGRKYRLNSKYMLCMWNISINHFTTWVSSLLFSRAQWLRVQPGLTSGLVIGDCRYSYKYPIQRSQRT